MARAAVERRRSGRPTVLFLDEIHRFNKRAAGRVPRSRRARRHRPDRRDHRESVVRGERRAACRARACVVLQASSRRPSCTTLVDARARRSARTRRSGDGGARRGPADRGIRRRRRAAGAQHARSRCRCGPDARHARPQDHHGRGRATGAGAQAPALRPRGRGALQPDLGAAQVAARLGSRTAGLYWLARMLAAGEDPLYVARRLVRFASEDVGNADPQALAARGRGVPGLSPARHAGGRAGARAVLPSTWPPRPRATPSTRASARAMEEVERSGSLPPPLVVSATRRPG